MPWEEKVIVTMREEFVKRVLSHEKSKAELCREYGISRPTGDKWIERYLNGQPLCDQSRAPHIVGNKTNDEVEKFIVEYRKKYPAIGATKIHRMLRDEGITDIPCPRTINEIFRTISITFRTAIVCVLIWFCICTIPLAFRRVSVCVCFICFASLRNFGHTR